jgi:translation initiation factor 2B subunit (eIF-2B alpha/beta/delta family)
MRWQKHIAELVSTLRNWRTETPDAMILHTAEQLETLAKHCDTLELQVAAEYTHAKTLNALLGEAEDRIKQLEVYVASIPAREYE